jgi:hypothetical protein
VTATELENGLEGERRGQVNAMAALLDELKPGWHERVNVDTLDLFDPNLCIIGQGFGATRTKWAEFMMTHIDGPAAQRNLDLNTLASNAKYREHWIALINERRLDTKWADFQSYRT